AGAVGPSSAREYYAWHRGLDLPDIAAALAAAVNADPTAARCDAAVNGILVAVADAGHLDLATVALRKVAPAVQRSGAVLGPAAVAHFAALLGKMGALKAAA
ncbi:MAG: hypothetical protein ACYC3K_16630, partial [Candidatus Nanopelagicales bacterium]